MAITYLKGTNLHETEKQPSGYFPGGKNYQYLLLSVLITGLSYGLYKGMLDNFLAEVVAMGEMDRGITEFFRELPGIALASMASNNYVQELSDSQDEVKATISTGVSINHVITIFIALFGGWSWQALRIETLFIASAILGLCNSAYAASIKTKKQLTT